MIGRTVSHYRILEKLGEGGMGVVYRAEDTQLDREVALKFLPAAFPRDGETSRRFVREAKILASLSHPNIAMIHSLEEDGERSFLVLELIQGENLSRRLARGAIPPAEALAIADQIAVALEAAHEMGVIHRDLKPANVMLAPDGQIKVLDFGLAKSVLCESAPSPRPESAPAPTVVLDETRPGLILGSPAYMSPEQARGEAIDRRTDIWAFGCVLWAMLAGKPVFRGKTASDLLATVLTGEPAWRDLPGNLHPAVRRLLRRCLQKDPRRRLRDIADARLEIEEARSAPADPPAEAGAVGRWARLCRPSFWGSLVGWLAAAALLILVLGPRPEPAGPVRIRSLTYSGSDWSPTISPDGSLIAFVSSRDGTARIWLKQVAGGGEEPLTAGRDDLPRFSPDGSQILFVRNDGGLRSLFRQSVVGGGARKMLDDVLEADWSPDGSRVAFLRGTPLPNDTAIVLGTADVQTGQERILARFRNRICYGVRWSPDGGTIAFNEASLTGMVTANSLVNLIDVETGAVRELDLTGWLGAYTAVEWSPAGESFLVGQPPDILSHVSSTPAKIMQYDLRTATLHPLFWSQLRLPRFGWGYSTLTVLGPGEIVFDDMITYSRLYEIPLDENGAPGSARLLVHTLGLDRQPAFSPDGEKIIFSSNRSGNVDLWLLECETGRIRQMTDDPADDWDPAFTPDGEHILWSSTRNGNMEIWMATAEGSHARQVSRDGADAENPTMSADGRWIVYSSANDDKLGIWRIRPDGTDASRLAAGSLLLPEVSPDGRYAMFSRFLILHSTIQVVEIETGELVPFEAELTAIEGHPNVTVGRCRWRPDGGAIYFVGQDEQGRIGLFVQDFVPGEDTSASRRQVTGFTTDYELDSMGISPDGRTLVVSRRYDERSVKLADGVRIRDWR